MPFVRRKNKKCRKCGIVGGLFWSQKRKNRPTKINVLSICQNCRRYDMQQVYYNSKANSSENIFMMEVL